MPEGLAEKVWASEILKGHGFQPCRKPLNTMCGAAEAAPFQGCQSPISGFFRNL